VSDRWSRRGFSRGAALLAVGWVLVAAGVVFFAVRTHRGFRAAIVRAFDEQQEFNASLIQQLLANHVRETVQDLRLLARTYQEAPTAAPDFGPAMSRVLVDHADDFRAIALVAPDGRLLFHSGGPHRGNPLDAAAFDAVDPQTADGPFLSERVITPEGQPVTYLVLPFRLPAAGGGRHLLVGELDFRSFLSSDLARIVGADVGVLLADYVGDIYFISSTDHRDLAEMERGRLFPPGRECLRCHPADSFEDIRRSVQLGRVVHTTFRSPTGRMLDRTDQPVAVLNETWVVSISSPYDRVQGQISANAGANAAAAAVLLVLLGAGAVAAHWTRERTLLQRHYYSIIDTIRVGMCRLDAAGTVVGANPAFGEMFGLPRDGVRGREFAGFAADPEEARAFLAGVAARGAVMDRELELARPGGGSFTAALSGVAVRAGGAGPAHVDVAVQDVTPRRRAELELRAAKELLERQNEDLKKLDRMKDALLRDVAHELKTPVAKHAMQLEILRPLLQARQIQDRELRAFQVMDESVRRQQGVIRNLLNLARLEAGGRVYRKEPLRLDELLRRVRGDYQYAIETHGIQFDVDAPEITVRSDEEMLWHVFSNLVNNAIKFRQKGVPPRIVVRAAATGAHAVVTVEDNGIGLPPAELERVFTRFYQVTASSEGSGVGLSICKNIVTDLGGSIRLTSAGPGQGTTVEVALPLG
jgi:PAS domain S-box-containing protein